MPQNQFTLRKSWWSRFLEVLTFLGCTRLLQLSATPGCFAVSIVKQIMRIRGPSYPRRRYRYRETLYLAVCHVANRLQLLV